MSGTVISITDYFPGALGAVCELHGRYYAREWRFGRAFETKVAADMAAFLDRFDPAMDLFKLGVRDDRVIGSITLDGTENDDGTAHLRWFIMADEARGTGLGGRLLNLAVDFAREKRFRGVYLWTFEGLHAARHLYEKAGFRLAHSEPGGTWGTPVTEQRFDLDLTA